MTLESIFASLLLANVLYTIAAKAANDERDWKKKLYCYAPFVMVSIVFYCIQGTVVAFTENLVTTVGNNSPAEIKLLLAAGMIAGIIVFGVIFFNNAFVKPEKSWQKPLWWLTGINIGLLVFVIYLKTNEALAFAPQAFIVFNGLMLLAALVYLWKSNLQKFMATPIAFHAAIALTIYFWYCRTGINYFQTWKNVSFENVSYWLIFYASAVVFNTIYDRGKDWHKRWSYRFISTYLLVMLVASLVYGFVNFFGSHAEERIAKAKLNHLQMKYLSKQLEVIGNREIGGVTSQMTEAILKNPDATLEEIEGALKRQGVIVNEMESQVASDPGTRPLHNEPTVNGWRSRLWNSAAWPWNWSLGGSTGGQACASLPPPLTPEQQLANSLARYTKLWGQPDAIVDLTDDSLKKVGIVTSGGRIHYLSSTDFWQGNKDVSSNSKLDTQVWNPCYHMIRGKGIRFMTSKDVEVYFKRFKQNTIVYAWIEKTDNPPVFTQKPKTEEAKKSDKDFSLPGPEPLSYNPTFQDFGVGSHPVKLAKGETLWFKVKRPLKMDFSLAADEKQFDLSEIDPSGNLGKDYEVYRLIAKRPLNFTLVVTNHNG